MGFGSGKRQGISRAKTGCLRSAVSRRPPPNPPDSLLGGFFFYPRHGLLRCLIPHSRLGAINLWTSTYSAQRKLGSTSRSLQAKTQPDAYCAHRANSKLCSDRSQSYWLRSLLESTQPEAIRQNEHTGRAFPVVPLASCDPLVDQDFHFHASIFSAPLLGLIGCS
jgi:hypothetical protein